MVVLGPGASLYFSLSFAYADPDLEPKWRKPRVVRTNRAAKACGACERSSKLGIRRVEAREPVAAISKKLPHALKFYDRIPAM